MVKKIILPVIFVVLAWGLWISPEFKEIAAGVAIFLFGMMALEQGFKAFTGGVLEKVLKASTDKLWKSLSFGVVTTTIMQSSSLVSVITISFLSAGLIGLAAGLGIIFGSNIGTTTGAWLVAGIGLKIDIAAYAMPMIVFGVILVFQKSAALKGTGYILAGIGFLFLGIHYMKTGFETFQDSLDLSQFAMTGLAGLLVYTGIGILATVVMQSSHATLILAITALAAGQISYENSLAIAIGSNVGTTITAVLGALSANVAGKRLALAHLIFNLTTGAIAIVFISGLAAAVDFISDGIGIAPDNYALKFAVFHTLFNVIGVSIMTPLINVLVRLLERIIPEKALDVSKPRFLNDAVLEFPDTALKVIAKEADHIYQNAFTVITQGLGLDEKNVRSEQDIAQVVAAARPDPALDFDDLYERRIRGLYNTFAEFAIRAETKMLPEQIALLSRIRVSLREVLQAIKDVKHLHKNMARYATSENAFVRHEYEDMRLRIAQVLRTLNQIRVDRQVTLDALDGLKKQIKRQDAAASARRDELIREQKITSEMLTSLINDSGYARDVSRKLIKAGRKVLKDETYDVLMTAHEDELADEDEPETLAVPEARAAS